MNYLELDALYCSQGDTSSKHKPKKMFKSAKGSFLYDENDIPYLDMQMFNSASNFGYQNPTYKNALNEQYVNLPSLAAEFMNENRIILSQKISEYMQKNYGEKGRVLFTVGGAQAVDDALKLSFNYAKNRGVICFEGSYHGRTMASSSISSSYRYVKQFGSVIETYRIPFPKCSMCPYDKCKNNCNLYCIDRIERLFDNEFFDFYDLNTNQPKYATFVFEPVLGRGGYVYPPKDYLEKIINLFRSHNIVIISDEVQMGFYRTGKQWSFEHYNICPDLIVFGKSITNGIWPLSGVWAKEKIINPNIWPTGSTHCTFSGHPIGTRMGIETFNIIENIENQNIFSHGSEKFAKSIKEISDKYLFISRAQVNGHAAGLDFYDTNTKLPLTDKVQCLVENALNKSVIVNGQKYRMILTAGGFHNSSLMLSPNLFISDKEIDLFKELLCYYINMSFTF